MWRVPWTSRWPKPSASPPWSIEKSLKESIEKNGELSRAIKSNAQTGELFRHAGVLEGLTRQAGMHAGGSS